MNKNGKKLFWQRREPFLLHVGCSWAWQSFARFGCSRSGSSTPRTEGKWLEAMMTYIRRCKNCIHPYPWLDLGAIQNPANTVIGRCVCLYTCAACQVLSCKFGRTMLVTLRHTSAITRAVAALQHVRTVVHKNSRHPHSTTRLPAQDSFLLPLTTGDEQLLPSVSLPRAQSVRGCLEATGH